MRKSVFILALLLACCGSDGDGAGAPPAVERAPLIANLKLLPENVVHMAGGGETQVSAELTFSDAGKDIQALLVGMPDGTRLEFSEASRATSGKLSGQIAMSTTVVWTVTVEIWLVDKAGDSSNHLTAKFEVVSDVTLTAWTRPLRRCLRVGPTDSCQSRTRTPVERQAGAWRFTTWPSQSSPPAGSGIWSSCGGCCGKAWWNPKRCGAACPLFRCQTTGSRLFGDALSGW